MEKFVARFCSLVTGVLSGFDRLVFRGHLLPLMREGGMYFFLKASKVRLLDFKDFAVATTECLKEASLAEARKLGRPIRYLDSPNVDKEDLARLLLDLHPVEEGLICVLSALEPCMTFEYHRSQNREERGLRLRSSKCLHLYKYYLHPRFGFMNARIQTWFPFNVQICLNGREWLARQLERKGRSDFKRVDNCFPWFGDPFLAQRLMDEQLITRGQRSEVRGQKSEVRKIFIRPTGLGRSTPSPAASIRCTRRSSSTRRWTTIGRAIRPNGPPTCSSRIRGLSPASSRCSSAMRSTTSRAPTSCASSQSRGQRSEVRGQYDKAGSVLRVETTIANTTDFKVLRPPHDDPEGPLAWRPLRKGVADLHRRAQVSQRSNDAYLEALTAVDDTTPCSRLFDAVSRPVHDDGRRFRALRLGDPDDLALLQAISRGEFATAGFRNRDLRRLLYPGARRSSPEEVRRLCARISRKLRLLRAHGVIKKIPKTHRYRLTERGQVLTAALFAAREASVKQLLANAS